MDYKLFFDRPSKEYDEALPVGNGKLGAMVSGAIEERQIWINEETVWYGGKRDRINPDAITHIDEIKELVKQERMEEAERLAIMTLTGIPESQRHYTTLGMAVLSFFKHNGQVKNYNHCLDFKTATATTTYDMDGISYQMDVHSNQEKEAIIVRLKSSEPVLDFFAGIERGERVGQFSYGTHQDETIRYEKDGKIDGIIITGSCGGKNSSEFASALFASSNGETKILGDKIFVKNASEATLYITAATDFKDIDIIETVTKNALSAREEGYEKCYEKHLAEWLPLYSSSTIKLESSESFIIPPSNKLFEAFASDDYSKLEFAKNNQSKKMLDDYLVLLLYHYGRYVLLSSSRKCELPASLQGIWCRDLLAIWDGKYTANINLQMTYWPSDSANMSECFEPYVRHAERIRESGTKTAKEMYDCRGFVMHNNTDIWADTAVQDSGSHCSYWFIGGVWTAIDMYEHYRYTLDEKFLNRVWSIMRDAALFVIDFMEENDEGQLVMGVTTSPENFYYDKDRNRVSFCEMTAMDSQFISLLFSQCIEAAEIIGDLSQDDKKFIEEVKSALDKLYPTLIGEKGTILEWGIEVEGAEPAHRHSSHVIGAYPYNNITENQPELLSAVEKSIDERFEEGGCYTGWARAWGAGLLARLKRGNDARDALDGLLQHSGQPNLMSCCNIGRIPKLLDNNKPFQVDGTVGMVQGVVEMLIQSHNNNELILLPALPDSWQTGEFEGLVGRGNIVVDGKWKDGKLVEFVLRPRCNVETNILYKEEFLLKTPKEEIKSEDNKVFINLIAGNEYYISLV